MTRECIYDKLRILGVSVETADAMAIEIVKLSDIKQDAVILWAGGLSYGAAASIIPMSKQGFHKIIVKIRKNAIPG